MLTVEKDNGACTRGIGFELKALRFVREEILDESVTVRLTQSREVLRDISASLVQVIRIEGKIHLLWVTGAEEENWSHENGS